MDARASHVLLWSRALVVGSMALTLGVVGHVMADGLLPGPASLVVMGLFSVLISVPMLTRRASAGRLVAMLAGGQTLIHLVLTVTAGHAGDPARSASAGVTRPGALAQSLVLTERPDGRRVGSLLDAYQSTQAPTDGSLSLPIGHLVSDMHAHAPMMLAHLLAAAAVALWLAHGERCLWTLVELTGRALLGALTWTIAATVLPTRFAVPTTAAAPRLRQDVLWSVAPRRGPPLLIG